jgi:NTP pyrophosphatase (non-canonical NTP hydrolase)
MMSISDKTDLAANLDALADEIHQTAVAKGWWEKERNFGEMISLMHSELSEALEGERHGNQPSEHIPEFSAVEEEFADTVIRILDTCKSRNMRIADAIFAKMEYNATRVYKHGGKKF